MKLSKKQAYMASAAALLLGASPAFAQTTPATTDSNGEEVIIVTGVARGQNRLDASISVSSISADQLVRTAPASTAEVLRSLPGVRAEASAGGGNSNIGVRGLPMSTGGAKYLSIQEDGLPLMLFGDFDFAPADGFYKADASLGRVESVRGGSAAVMSTNGPGGIINFINQNGENDGGMVGITTGLSYSDLRGEFAYSAHLDANTYYMVSGHFQQGGDVRNFGFDPTTGGQLRASITHEFDNGYIRVIGKWLDRRDPLYMPQPIELNGNNFGDGVPGLSALDETMHSNMIRYGREVNGNNEVIDYDLADGMHTIVKSIGTQLHFDIGNGWTFDDNFRYQQVGGSFRAPFVNAIFDANRALATTGTLGNGTNRTATWFNGPHAGQAVTSASLTAANGNPFIAQVAFLAVDLTDMGNMVNDMKFQREFDVGGTDLDVTVGYFFMNQNFGQDWHWNDVLTDVGSEVSLLNVSGLTDNGIYGYNHGFGWNGNNRNYNLDYQARSPYLAANWNLNNGWILDAGIRRDSLHQGGIVTQAAGRPYDVDGDGIIDPPEMDVSVNTGVGPIANFTVANTAYTFGATYRLSSDMSVFGRVSSGASFNGERKFPKDLDAAGMLTTSGTDYVDTNDQLELGFKWRERGEVVPGDLNLYVTYFHANTNEHNFDITAPAASQVKDKEYTYQGIEFESQYVLGGFNFTGTVTYTDAEITNDRGGNTDGNRPKRQAPWIWALTPSYSFGDTARIGASFIGSTDRYAEDDNVYVMPGATVTNLFFEYNMSEQTTFSLNVNNVFDTLYYTEGNNDGRQFDVDNNGRMDHTVARAMTGRTLSASVRYRF